jgi:lysophospholipase L1-like esterase
MKRIIKKWSTLAQPGHSRFIYSIPITVLGKTLQQKKSIKIEFTYLQVAVWALVLLTGAYVAWEIYWYNKVGLHFIKWHTHLVFTAMFFGLLVHIPLLLFSRFSKILRPGNSRTITASVVFTFLLIEITMMLSGKGKTYSESTNGYYISPFTRDKNIYHTYPPNSKSIVKTNEFIYPVSYNSLGFVGAEWPIQKDSTKIRIITLGDSFTEGYGAPSDSSYPALLSKIVGEKYEILNAGVCGSDPVFCLKNVEDRLLNLKPDLLVQSISENDIIFDLCVCGGYERYNKGGSTYTQSVNSPAWEPLYAISYSSRIFFHALGYNLSRPCGDINNPSFITRQNLILKDVCDRYESLGIANNINVLIVFYPTLLEVSKNKYNFDLTEAKRHISSLSHVKFVDLFSCYQSKILYSGIKPIEYYWAIDGHHNSLGYRLMAECIASAVKPLAETDTCKKLP